MDKPFIEQMRETIPSAQDITGKMSETTGSMGATYQNAKESVQTSLSEFSSKSMDASTGFLNSNGLLAKFAFIILVFLIFLLLLKIGLSMVAFFMGPAANPYLVRGMIQGYEKVNISQNPKDSNTIPILRSNDKYSGIEYTWSIWLKLDSITSLLSNIFVKGSENFYDFSNNDVSGSINILNGPGLYVTKYDKEAQLKILSDNVKSLDIITVPNIPLSKWFHVAIRLQNMIMDIYVNGTIIKRKTFANVPKQNYSDVLVNGNGGFAGSLSNLRYYGYALNVFEINNIVVFGPDTTTSSLSRSNAGKGTTSYLSSKWYN